MFRRCTLWAMVSAWWLAVLAAPALGQVDLAPTPKYRWVPILIAAVLGLAVLAASIMSSRRGHRD